MIKLQSTASAPSAFSVLTLESVGSSPGIIVSVKESRKQIEGNWVSDPQRLRQTVTFFGPDGDPVSMSGLVDEASAVEISGAHKVVMEVAPSSELKGAYDKGRVSQAYTALEIVRVLEVWSSRTSKLWESPERKSLGASAKSFDGGTGKIA
jgi:hypothetical protein